MDIQFLNQLKSVDSPEANGLTRLLLFLEFGVFFYGIALFVPPYQ